MKLGMQIDYSGGFKESAKRVADYEKAGLDIAWVAEAYGFDAATFMGYLAATTESITIASGILPIYTRTPTLIAMTAAGMDALTDGRFILGLGASGPQVIEGFHGVRYDAPLGRTREIIDICRQVWKRERVEYDGRYYTLPLPADRGTGLGKPLKIIAKPVREEIPIWIASLGPKNVEMTAEVANGWLPIFFMPERADEVWGADLAAGRAKRAPELGPLEIAAGGLVAIGDDAGDIAELSRPMVALYVGGMGAKGRNFYNDLMCRYGYEAEAAKIQDLYLEGKKDEAAAIVPKEFLELTNLCGPEGFVRDRLEAFKEAGVSVLNIIPVGDNPTAMIEKLKTWVS
ncbi:COG2141 Coenzyme F420-dependent N5,N10-methylene tetrahydromethanopterin reductase and related flavin-dependent oxidoreductases [Acidimicrobiia bacterium]